MTSNGQRSAAVVYL